MSSASSKLANGHKKRSSSEGTIASGETKSDGVSTVASSASLFGPPTADKGLAHNSSESITDYLYKTCFLQGYLSDVNVLFDLEDGDRCTFLLHALIITRSPMLDALFRKTKKGCSVIVKVESRYVTREALRIVLGHLYGGPTQTLLTSKNALSLLAAACLLDIEDICTWSAGHASSHLEPEHVPRFLGVLKSMQDTKYSELAKSLKQIVLRYLVKDLPTQLQAFATLEDSQASEEGSENPENLESPESPGNTKRGEKALQDIYSGLDFDILQHCVESPDLPIRPENVKTRFDFAKRVIEARKTIGGHSVCRNSNDRGASVGAGEEEYVVMSFGFGEGPASENGTVCMGAVKLLKKTARQSRRFKKASSCLTPKNA